ncbi:hypothetical protein NIES4072_03760 [Nostoc commune NIES-4072]|uniref:Uncharacterized protein n=1 Tax=Nostoc commune NIES-4072 TaxID=2005467 RepID=A0A2R5FEA3_NOSCO|nr:hypothetical protein [Nostoc commune]BBD65945.1 hypothetical protein NIES4070_23060 [Nostoc commune HK-02]GBG16730.1 hypothetical protein NIES4072_03760 [Nostoc commune NIES-4072]
MLTRNLITSFTLGITLAAIPILQSQAQVQRTPNLYNFTGYNSKGEKVATINYSTSSFTGKPLFNYQQQKETLNFTGDEIRTVDTEIGTLVTVTIKKTIDTGNTTFTLLIPRVNLGNNIEAKVETKGITTTNRFSVIPQFNQGQKQTYTTINLRGTAQSVAF